MARLLLTTVGTSVLTNLDWRRGQAFPCPSTIAKAVRADPRRASAELNVLDRLRLTPDDAVVLLPTDSEDGKAAARALTAALASWGVPVETAELPLPADAPGMRGRGLAALAAQIAERARRARDQGCEPLLNLNGGFKSQTATALAVAAAEGIPALYTHESFDEIVEIPPLPLAWDTAFFLAAEPALDVLERCGPVAEFEAVLARLAPTGGFAARVRALAVVEGDDAMLSPLVQTAYERYRAAEALAALCPVLLSARAAKELDGAGSLRPEFARLIRKAADPDSSAWSETKRNAPTLRFLPKGRVNAHIAFYEDGEGITVAALWSVHDDYTKAVDAGDLRRDAFPDVESFTL